MLIIAQQALCLAPACLEKIVGRYERVNIDETIMLEFGKMIKDIALILA